MAAGRSAVPAADASAVMAITSPTGPSTLTASARASIIDPRIRSPARSTDRRS